MPVIHRDGAKVMEVVVCEGADLIGSHMVRHLREHGYAVLFDNLPN